MIKASVYVNIWLDAFEFTAAVFKTKELSNVLDRQLKNLMTHFLLKVPVDKISLSCFDDKRYIHENGVTSYAYGFENSEIFWI